MRGMTLEAAVKAVGGIYTGPEEARGLILSSVTIDSRKVEKGCLFVALKGARVDGNDFIPDAYGDGAACCMSVLPAQDREKPYIQVASCEQALKDLAQYYRSVLDVRVIGITGSVGKTSTKEMIASVVSQQYDVLKTPGNFNNEIGLPLTVFSMREHHQIAILEMGISDFGEMSRLAKVADPDICVITNIGPCHLENLGTRDGVLRAKTEMFDYMRPGGAVYLNGDDDKLRTLADDPRIASPFFFGLGQCAGSCLDPDNGKSDPEGREGDRCSSAQCAEPCLELDRGKSDPEGREGDRCSSAQCAGSCLEPDSGKSDPEGGEGDGTDHGVKLAVTAADIRTLGLDGIRADIITPAGSIRVTVPAPGRHMLSNALAAAAVGVGLGLSLQQIRDGIEAYEPVDGHGQMIHAGELTIMDDCYNANPASMRAGLDVLASAQGRRVAILGDMFELGEQEEQMHCEVGGYAASRGIDTILAVGRLAAHLSRGAQEYRSRTGGGGQVFHYSTVRELLADLQAHIRPGDTVLVKASHGMHLEEVVEELKRVFAPKAQG